MFIKNIAGFFGMLLLAANIAMADKHAAAETTAGDADQAAFEAVRAQVSANRQALVAENLPLADEVADKFWPLYREFHVKRDMLADRRIKGLQEFYENFDSLTEKQAKQLLDDYVKLQEDRLALQKTYIGKFRSVLSEKKTLRYFQIEHRLDAIIEDELVQVVPLAE